MTAKASLRQALRLRLSAMAPALRQEKSRAVAKVLSGLLPGVRTVALFAPMATEPDIHLLWPELDAGQHVIAYPRMEGEHLRFFAVDHPLHLLASRWNLLEPPPSPETEVRVADLELVLVPGLAFTRDGGRMGHGRGFYDRLLADPAFRALAVGVCFEEQVVDHLPLEAHDRRVDRVVSA